MPQTRRASTIWNFAISQRIDNAQLVGPTYTAAAATGTAVAITAGVNVYAVNYNVIHIMVVWVVLLTPTKLFLFYLIKIQ